MKVPRSQAIKVRQTAGQTPISWSLPVGGTPLKKKRQNLLLDPGRYSGRLRDCPFLGGWRALLRGGVHLGRCDGIQSLGVFVELRTAASSSPKRASNSVRKPYFYCGISLYARSQK